MVEAYNHYLGGYLPRTSAKSNVHQRSELKKIYKNIRNLNQQSPLALVRLSDDRQAYALDVKEMAMELEESTDDVLSLYTERDEKKEAFKKTIDGYNRLLKRSDEYGKNTGNPSRPGGELRMLVQEFQDELKYCGVSVQEDGTLSLNESEEEQEFPEMFLTSLNFKSRSMSMNPMEYVEKKVFSYGFLSKDYQPSTYQESVYSGMLFNSYC